MCGIIGVVRRASTRPVPDLGPLVEELGEALDGVVGVLHRSDGITLGVSADALERVDSELMGVPGVRALLADVAGADVLDQRAQAVADALSTVERELDEGHGPGAGVELEMLNAALARARDAAWAIRHDRIGTARAVAALAGPDPSLGALEVFVSVQVALAGLDRLEVRGRDSAGLYLLLRDHALDLSDPAVRARMAARATDPLFGSGSVRAQGDLVAFVYKAAAEIGELGDNVRVLRAALTSDALLHEALANDTANAVVLGHTRWASVGIISEPNTHPLDDHETDRDDGGVVAALNGDVDNYDELAGRHSLALPAEITTDAKVIPALVARARADGLEPLEAFRMTTAELEGSVAVALCQADAPAQLFLAVRGGGQALYVGVAEDAFVVASEPYGVVAEAPRSLRLEGEVSADERRRAATRGQIVTVDADMAGTVAGITRLAYDGTPVPVGEGDLEPAEITTRDIDRGAFPHYLLKEIVESPDSFRKTLRGKVIESQPGSWSVTLGPETLTDDLRARLRAGAIRRVVVVGQGTAAVAGQAVAVALRATVDDRVVVDAVPATELSGFGLRSDMSDMLVIAISQSGTTTDTNRTVDLARERGAAVVAIVNRRNSDLCAKSDGVLYTSDGRDVEMSVASTKAFYAQVAAGWLLALGVATELGLDPEQSHGYLEALRAMPDAMRSVIERREEIAAVAQRHVLSRRSWAVVGSGPNLVAARELRIKLSELCYKAIACDVTEDKKHIDLSSEPLVLVCAAGLSGSNVEDIAKEVAIYRAHRGAPIVITGEAEASRFTHALETIPLPSLHPELDFVLATVAGHLFSYEAALAIDASARPFREARAAIEAALPGPPDEVLERLAARLEAPAQRFFDTLRAGGYDGSLEASTATTLASRLRYATGMLVLDTYEIEHGKVGAPGVVVDDLAAALTRAIEELTRPVDAIKHQAKTVTVGISRSDETLLGLHLAREVLAAGAPRDGLSYRVLRTLANLDPAVAEVTGFTRYRIEGDATTDDAIVHVVDRGGIATTLVSRTDADPRLRGTKHRVATQRDATAVRGRADDRTLVIVPEVKHNDTVGLTLLHVRFADLLPAAAMRAVLEGYHGRYAALKDAVTETEPAFDDALLAEIPVVDLLTQPVNQLADRWRRA